MIELSIIISVAIVAGSVFAGFKMWLDRLHPPHQPDPDGKELLERLEAHEKQVKKDIDALAGRIAFREKGRLRE